MMQVWWTCGGRGVVVKIWWWRHGTGTEEVWVSHGSADSLRVQAASEVQAVWRGQQARQSTKYLRKTTNPFKPMHNPA